jgi:demethylmenaquinone methyltransferase / 2-methoxy-6-polyprenyl-1,4-benzoquinol methylase
VRVGLPAAGAVVSPGWHEVGRFLGPSIRGFHARVDLERVWREAGLTDVRLRRLSVGGGVVVWAVKP